MGISITPKTKQVNKKIIIVPPRLSPFSTNHVHLYRTAQVELFTTRARVLVRIILIAPIGDSSEFRMLDTLRA
jgi:hypothetical protein